MSQLSSVPATSFVERLRAGAARRPVALGLTLLVEALLLLMLLTFGSDKLPGTEEERLTVVNVRAPQVPERAPEPSEPEPKQQTEEQPVPERPPPDQPTPPQPAQPIPTPPVRALIPVPQAPPPPAPSPAPPPPRRVYGPPNVGGSASLPDTERVGTAPNGEPLYAAAWYREPTPGELRGYLSTAQGPGWGLIACRTASEYRVEDCVGLGEYPTGSQIARAVLAAAWQFKVRPPRKGGQLLVGSWVRIRIDYEIRQR